MAANAQDTSRHNRLDHLLPRCYLDGFCNPTKDGELWVFDRLQRKWFPTGPPRVSAIRGFYDYSAGSEPDQTADEAFANLETRFAVVRRELVASHFSDWDEHLDFLLGFAQMLRARSERFRQQDVGHTQKLQMLEVVEVLARKPSEIYPDSFNETLKVRPYAPDNQAEYEALLRNKAITDMRTEVGRGAAWLRELHWCLRLASSHTNPAITADNPVVVDGKRPTLEEAPQDTETLVFFAVCWQACLVGSHARFHKETDVFNPRDLEKLRGVYLKSANRFLFSPSRITFHEDAHPEE